MAGGLHWGPHGGWAACRMTVNRDPGCCKVDTDCWNGEWGYWQRKNPQGFLFRGPRPPRALPTGLAGPGCRPTGKPFVFLSQATVWTSSAHIFYLRITVIIRMSRGNPLADDIAAYITVSLGLSGALGPGGRGQVGMAMPPCPLRCLPLPGSRRPSLQRTPHRSTQFPISRRPLCPPASSNPVGGASWSTQMSLAGS